MTGPADIAVEDGTSLIVYATGILQDGEQLPILTETITGLGETPEEVPTGNSPIDEGMPVALIAMLTLGVVALGGAYALRRNNG